jgi:hypothetical protein
MQDDTEVEKGLRITRHRGRGVAIGSRSLSELVLQLKNDADIVVRLGIVWLDSKRGALPSARCACA